MRTGSGGSRGRLVAALLTGAVLTTTTGCRSDDGPTREDGKVVEAGDESVDRLSYGDCFDADGIEETIDEITLVPCTESHTHQVYAVDRDAIADAGFSTYPGAPELEAVASAHCYRAYGDVFGVAPTDDPARSFTYVYPTLKSFTEGIGDLLDKKGDRTIVCVLVTDPTTESAVPDDGADRRAEG